MRAGSQRKKKHRRCAPASLNTISVCAEKEGHGPAQHPDQQPPMRRRIRELVVMNSSRIASRLRLAVATAVGAGVLAIAQPLPAQAAFSGGGDPSCGSSGAYVRDWPGHQGDYALLSRTNANHYSATTVVEKDGPCKPCNYTSTEKYGPVPLPDGQYTQANGKLMFWDAGQWIAIGYDTYPGLMGASELRAYGNVVRFRSTPAADGKGQCVSTQIASTR
jgi:hypothetical protein